MDIENIMSIVTPILLTVCGGAVTLAGKWLIRGQQDIKDDISQIQTGLDKRVSNLEAENKTFMNKDDLRSEFEHEAAGRKAIKEASESLIRKNADDIIMLREKTAKLEQNDANLTSQYHDLKSSVEKGFEKTDSKLEKITDCLAEISKKVA